MGSNLEKHILFLQLARKQQHPLLSLLPSQQELLIKYIDGQIKSI